jgi:hypothetical protein
MKVLITSVCILLLSCGSRKAEIDRLKVQVKQQRDLVLKIQNNIQSNVNVHKVATKTIAEPIDSSKPSTFNGTSFQNARITTEETETDSTAYLNDQSEKEVDLSESSKVNVSDKQKKSESKKGNPWLWLAITIVAVFLIWRLLKTKPWV